MLKNLGNEDDANSKPATGARSGVSIRIDRGSRYKSNADEVLTSFYEKKMKEVLYWLF